MGFTPLGLIMKIFKNWIIPLTIGVLVKIILFVSYPIRWIVYKVNSWLTKRKRDKNKLRL